LNVLCTIAKIRKFLGPSFFWSVGSGHVTLFKEDPFMGRKHVVQIMTIKQNLNVFVTKT